MKIFRDNIEHFQEVGTSCEVDNDCNNRACGRETAADNAPLVCCKSGKNINYYRLEYCTDMPGGATCWSDAMCASGICSGNMGGFRKGICKAVSCELDNDCENRACGRESAADDASLVCCNGGKKINHFGSEYCTDMPGDATCWSDAMCASGICSGNMGGFSKGTCDAVNVAMQNNVAGAAAQNSVAGDAAQNSVAGAAAQNSVAGDAAQNSVAGDAAQNNLVVASTQNSVAGSTKLFCYTEPVTQNNVSGQQEDALNRYAQLQEEALSNIVAEEEEKDETWWGWFKNLFYYMLIALLVVLLITAVLIGGLLLFGYFLGGNYFRRLFSWICANKWTYGTLTVAPVIMEVVGIALSFVGIGIPIIGLGMFLEVLTIICDYLRRSSRRNLDLTLGVFGLVPILGTVANIAKIVNLFRG